MEIAIVTGASSGIGRQFVLRAIAKERFDEIWVIARRKDRLEELAQMAAVPLRILPLDLKEPESIGQVKNLLEAEQPQVNLLVNAAGFAKFGPAAGLTDEEVSDMVQLDVHTLTMMTKIVLPYLKPGSRVIQVGSTSAFHPLPDLAVYAAAKSYVVSFSRALHRELHKRGITVTAVCPGWTGTEFLSVAQNTGNPNAVRRFPFLLRPADVAEKALRDAAKGRDVSVPGFHNKGHRLLAKLLPHRLMMAGWERIKN